jgi:hypothetical protein
VVTSHAATEERNTPYTYVQFTNLLDRLSLGVINFLGQKAWIFLKDGSVFWWPRRWLIRSFVTCGARHDNSDYDEALRREVTFAGVF